MVASLIRLIMLRSLLRSNRLNQVRVSEEEQNEDDDISEIYEPAIEKDVIEKLQAAPPPSRQTSHARAIKEKRRSLYACETELPQVPNHLKQVRFFFTHIGIFLSLLIYAFIGAAIFQALEQTNEKASKLSLIKNKNSLISNISSLNITDPNYNVNLTHLITTYEQQLARAVHLGLDITQIDRFHQQNVTSKWNYFGSLFFAGTVFTTIGYGNIAPVTPGGRIATMIYAVFGIPLCLIVLSDIGGLLSKGLKHLMVKIINSYRKSECHQNSQPDLMTVETIRSGHVLLVLAFCVMIYLFAIASIYLTWETNWHYLDGFYFLFISVTTIGFGDVLPDHPRFFLISFILIFLGLSLFSTIFTVFQELLHQTITKAAQELDYQLGVASRCPSEVEVDVKKSPPSKVNKWARKKSFMDIASNVETTPV